MNNNNNFEFKSYIPTPTDQYMLGLAKVKLYGKVVANFKHVKTKDGTGDFFCPASYTITDAGGEKKYISCVMLDSRDDEEALMEFIRVNVHASIAQRSALKAQQQPNASGAYYPHGMAQQSTMMTGGYVTPSGQNSIAEVTKQDDLPF